jgi:hypothetical protein
VFLFLPDSPLNAKFLNERERSIAFERLRETRTGIKTSQFKWHQAKDGLLSPNELIRVTADVR